MRTLRWLGLSLVLSGCAPMVQSDKPLFETSGVQPKPGLWAVMQADCTPPRVADVGSWPECATPVWFRDGMAATYFDLDPEQPGPARLVRFPVVGAAGSPYVLQISSPSAPGGKDVEAPRHTYWALKPGGAAPFDQASVWVGLCPEQRNPDPDAETPCEAESEDQVRSWLGETMRTTPAQVAVWIAP